MDPANEIASSLSGEHIAKMLRTDGPTVSCVLLHSCHPTPSENSDSNKPDQDVDKSDAKLSSSLSASLPSSSLSSSVIEKEDDATADADAGTKSVDAQERGSTGVDNGDKDHLPREVLTDLITEIKIDTTPKKQMVAHTLGGPFTFLGQYEDEGTVVIVRRQEGLNIGSSDKDNAKDDGNTNVANVAILNPHQLQPPLHAATVYGDILLMRVAATEEGEEEVVQERDENPVKGNPTIATAASVSKSYGAEDSEGALVPERIVPNDEFFLHYTKEEYIKFASRTDIVPQELPEQTIEGEDDASEGEEIQDDEEEGDDEDEGEDDEQDGDYEVGSDEEDMEEDECQIGVMNIILAQILKRFREENGRGPNTEELLAMRSALAEKLGIDEALINDPRVSCDENQAGEKRKADGSTDDANREKRVKFTGKDEIKIMTDDEGTANEGNEEDGKNAVHVA